MTEPPKDICNNKRSVKSQRSIEVEQIRRRQHLNKFHLNSIL